MAGVSLPPDVAWGVFEHCPQPVIVTTAPQTGRSPEILYVNQAFERLTGWTGDEVLGRTPSLLQGPDTDRELLERLRRSMVRGDPFEGETVNYTKDGRRFINRWRMDIYQASPNVEPVWIAYLTDMTPTVERIERLELAERRFDDMARK